jgi:hypothetical protein
MELRQSQKRKIKLEGTQIGYFTDIKYIGTNVKNRAVLYECTCKCGNKTVVTHQHLNNGHTKSCGCYNEERKRTHGQSHSQLYEIWTAMKQRCFNPNCPSYSDYGGRGITMSEEFANDFTKFRDYMGERPTKRSSVERLNVHGNYEPGNIVWAEPTQQAMNKRKQTNNTSGKTGVHRTVNRGVEYFVATVQVRGKIVNKYLNIEKYGEELAFSLACKARDNLVKEANSKGAMFTENHGK